MNKDIIVAIFDYIKENTVPSRTMAIGSHATNFVKDELNSKGISATEDEILDNFAYLLNIGILRPFLNSNNSLPHLSLSEYGKKCLENNELGLLDINGEIEKLKIKLSRINQNLDETVEIYFSESVYSFYKNSFLASAILIGGASERLILILNESVKNHLAKHGKTLNSDFSNNKISKKFNAIKNHIDSIKPSLPSELTDGIHNRLIGVFENIRLSRNEAGHPEINYKYIDRASAEAHLLLFPNYCELIYKLKNWFDNN